MRTYNKVMLALLISFVLFVLFMWYGCVQWSKDINSVIDQTMEEIE